MVKPFFYTCLTLLLLLVLSISACHIQKKSSQIQSEANPPIQVNQLTHFNDNNPVLQKLEQLATHPNKKEELETFWNTLVKEEQIPYRWSDSLVAFFYRGPAQSVHWVGDFTGWKKEAPWQGQRLGNSDIWLAQGTFPADARLDYKIIVDENWILDPANKKEQWAGVNGGQPNSALQMPAWKAEKESKRQAYIPVGKTSEKVRIPSRFMNYEIQYEVYTPYNYGKVDSLPVIYVFDGQEYNHPKMGNMSIHLNNLIAKKKIEPIIAVFIDPRNPDKLEENRRENELRFNENYISFVVEELVPQIDVLYKTKANRENRALLGTSYGGLCVSNMAFHSPDIFSKVGIHSPAFWYEAPKIFDLYKNSPRLPLSFYMSTGSIHDTKKEALKMKNILENKGYPLTYTEVNQGHSWGNWRSLIDDVLITFF